MKTELTRPYSFTNTRSMRLVNLQSTVWITHTHTTSPWSFTQHWASRLIGFRLSLSNKERMESDLNPVYKVSARSVCLLNGGSTKNKRSASSLTTNRVQNVQGASQRSGDMIKSVSKNTTTVSPASSRRFLWMCVDLICEVRKRRGVH